MRSRPVLEALPPPHTAAPVRMKMESGLYHAFNLQRN